MPRVKILKVRDVMSKKVATLTTDMTVKEAALVLVKNKMSGAPVLNKNKKLVGMVSEKDLFKALYPTYKELYIEESLQTLADPEKMQDMIKSKGSKPVTTALCKKLITTTPETPLVKIGAIMLSQSIHRLPVMSKAGNFLGIISREDLYRTIFKQFFGK